MPTHPGIDHYIIHAYDYPPLADRALNAALKYQVCVTVVPHAIHIPSHTFVLLGRWQDAINANIAAQEAESDRGIPEDRIHDLDYLVLAYLQLGQDKKAKETVDLAREIENDIGLARLGRLDEAQAEVNELVRLSKALADAQLPYWAGQVEIQEKIASGWIARARGQNDEAIALMQAAAKQEDGLQTHDTLNPGPIGMTADESLGTLLLELHHPADAFQAFESSLRGAKNRLAATLAPPARRRLGMMSRMHVSTILK
jgi:tetratricopeptide (TPR) repeat protein